MFDQMTDMEFAAYLAGFTDGEGYIGVEPTTRKNVSAVRIVLANCVPEVLRGIQSRLGYGSIRSQTLKANWRERYTLSITNLGDAERFLSIVYPYLFIKREAADAAYLRIAEAKQNHLGRQIRNDAIRAAAKEGQMRKAIANQFNVSPQLVSRICEGHDWPSERSRVAKTRKRGTDGLFLPIEH